MFKQNRLVARNVEGAGFGGNKSEKYSRKPQEDALLGFGDSVSGDLVKRNEDVRRSPLDMTGVRASAEYRKGYKFFRKSVDEWFAVFKNSPEFARLEAQHPDVMSIVDMDELAQEAALPIFEENAIQVAMHNQYNEKPKWTYGIGVIPNLMPKMFERELFRMEGGNERNLKRFAEKIEAKKRFGGMTVDIKEVDRGIYWALDQLFNSGENGPRVARVYIRNVEGLPKSRTLMLEVIKNQDGSLRFSMIGDKSGNSFGANTFDLQNRFKKEQFVAGVEKWVLKDVIPKAMRGDYGALDDYYYV